MVMHLYIKIENPTYESVCSGNTGHAEVCKITFDSLIITYEELLKVFFKAHNPTTLNKQGADTGTQYRSSIFYLDETQKISSLKYIKTLENENVFNDSIKTTVEKFLTFYKAEDYHQDYYNLNKEAPYCQSIIKPKIEKLFK